MFFLFMESFQIAVLDLGCDNEWAHLSMETRMLIQLYGWYMICLEIPQIYVWTIPFRGVQILLSWQPAAGLTGTPPTFMHLIFFRIH